MCQVLVVWALVMVVLGQMEYGSTDVNNLADKLEVHVNSSTKIHYPPKQVGDVYGIDLVMLETNKMGSKPGC